MNKDVESIIRYYHKGMTDRGGCGGPVLFAMVLLLFLLTSCKQTEYVTVEKVRTDTTYVTKWQKDSVWLHDSVYVKETSSGDTVFLNIEKWHTRYVTKEVHDTLYKARVDSIPVPYEVVKEVAAELSWWQKLRLWLGNITLIGILGLVGYGGFKLYKVVRFF